MFGSKFAPSVGGKQFARVEPVLRRRAGEDRRQFAVELRDGRAAMVPERCTVGHVLEAHDLFDAAVAVRSHDEDATGKLGRRELRQS